MIELFLKVIRTFSYTPSAPTGQLIDPAALNRPEDTFNPAFALGMIRKRMLDGFHAEGLKETYTGETLVEHGGLRQVRGREELRHVLKELTFIVLTAVHIDGARYAPERFTGRYDNSTAECFGDGITVGHDGYHPTDDAARCAVHPSGESRPNSDLLFVGFAFDSSLDGDPHKEIKLMMVALKDFSHHEWSLPLGKESILGSPFPDTFTSVTDDLLRNVREKSVDGFSTVGDEHELSGRRAGRWFPHG